LPSITFILPSSFNVKVKFNTHMRQK
jgi:hypothetical protein